MCTSRYERSKNRGRDATCEQSEERLSRGLPAWFSRKGSSCATRAPPQSTVREQLKLAVVLTPPRLVSMGANSARVTS